MAIRINARQSANGSDEVLGQMHEGGVDCAHATIACHETVREMVANITHWNQRFEARRNRTVQARSADDVRGAARTGRTAGVFGLQTPMPVEGDIGLVEVLHTPGVRVLQLSCETSRCW